MNCKGGLVALSLGIVIMSIVLVVMIYLFYTNSNINNIDCSGAQQSLSFVETRYSCYDASKGQSSFSLQLEKGIERVQVTVGQGADASSVVIQSGAGNDKIRALTGNFGEPIVFNDATTTTFIYKGDAREIHAIPFIGGQACAGATVELPPCTPDASSTIDSMTAPELPLPPRTSHGGGGGGGSTSSTGPPQCSDGLDNDNNGFIDWPFDPGCTDLQDTSEFGGSTGSTCGNGLIEGEQCDDGNVDDGDGCSTLCEIEPNYICSGEPSACHSAFECEDGLDNDGDDWTDVEDPDCTQADDKESWIGLSTCSDGIDNNRNGLTDRDDTSCTSALESERSVSTVGFRSGGFSECSDGLDNDNDGLADYPHDPGCTDLQDTSESDEVRTHAFNFSFGPDGYIQEINWTNSSGAVKRVVWDEFNGRYGGGSGVRYYFHSTLNGLGGSAWSYKVVGTQLTALHQSITYKKLFQSGDEVSLSANDSRLLVNDTVRFYNNTFLIRVVITNTNLQKLDNVTIPFYLGSLIIGNYDANYQLNLNDSGISRITPIAGGLLETNYTDNGAFVYRYPSIPSFAPITVLGDSRITLGQQYLTHIIQPDFVEFAHKAYAQYTPTMRSKIHIDTLAPGESKTFVVAYSVANSGQWQQTLELYKKWFTYDNRDTTPSYCPTGQFNDLVGSNNQQYYNNVTHRYLPNTPIKALFVTDATRGVMQQLGFESFGLWETALNSACLIGDKNCSRTFIQECFDKGNIGGLANCEFSGNIDLIDPNIDAGRNKTKIKDLTDSYALNNISVFWYVRPCGEIYGANITFDVQGNEVFTAGTPSGYADEDLRNITNRNRQFMRVFELAQQGVRGFYFDATGCPGDEGFFEYVKRNLTQTFGTNFFFLTEGARDREALWIPQAPLIKNPDYSGNSSLLISYLVPQGTYYGGIFNNPLNDSEFADILAKGYQAIPLNYPPTLAALDSVWDGEKIGVRACRYINQSFANRYALWQSYGSDLGCAAPSQTPPPCPVS